MNQTFLNNPEYVVVDNQKVKINTDFRVALKCQSIATDDSINDIEKTLTIIYLLFGEEGLNGNIEEYANKAVKFLSCGREFVNQPEEEPYFDYEQDWGYIKASFMSDYGIDLDNAKMHLWTFYDLLNGLTKESKLSQVMSIRLEPLEGKKGKEREALIEAKKSVELKHKKTAQEEELDRKWVEMLRK